MIDINVIKDYVKRRQQGKDRSYYEQYNKFYGGTVGEIVDLLAKKEGEDGKEFGFDTAMALSMLYDAIGHIEYNFYRLPLKITSSVNIADTSDVNVK